MSLKLKYILYFFSYFLVYPFSFPIIFPIGMWLSNPELSKNTVGLGFFILCASVTILGAGCLNVVFKNGTNLDKNTKYSWAIFISHLILIPLTYILYTN
ncbi:hypothetical protein BAMA_16595 [Bacillus manliponensis]|uniref:Uncharacterized protein n=1 Tax=Bacillus manliponensis TaxID=574376 RepID=A0A073K0P9_9BACI|nr:hypothetical protein [Bacillus manliponensis]KEK20075.1 hypothetical protein BAMA_16595 [Bacillus manliponensis]